MDQRTLRILEYFKIKDILSGFTVSTIGKEMVEELEPKVEIDNIKTALQETTEAAKILQEGNVPLVGIRDIRIFLRKAEMGGILEPEQLLDVAQTLRACRIMRKFLLNRKEEDMLLKEIAEGIQNFTVVEEEISKCIGEDGEILDSASAELNRIRKQIKTQQNRIRDKLESFLRMSEYQKAIQESLITIREDRYVIPIKHEYRGQFPGLVHDQSASGATLFIEPIAVVELNNALKQLYMEEKKEVERILLALSGLIGASAGDITDSVKLLGKLDFIFAKGKLSLEWRCTEPFLNEKGYLDIKAARHPLLGEKVVPIDVYLGKHFHTLIITGPNTGGKTVTLKTVGLFALMTQSGLHIPAREGTEICIFERIFSDIGDEQSIEQSLSTFSSHMTHIIEILSKLGRNSLVLLDELGAGTDPAEGAALAMAILSELHEKGIRTLATTHYSELKTFAYSQTGIENACVEFNVESLRPTYRLLIGRPGKSNAFEIAFKLGLSTQIIDKAKEYLVQENVKIEEIIEKMQEAEKRLEVEIATARNDRQEFEKLKKEYQEKQRSLYEKEEEILRKANDKADSIIRETRRETEGLIYQLRQAEKNLKEIKLQEVAQSTREKLKSIGKKVDANSPASNYPGDNDEILELRPGQEVMVKSLNKKGNVLTKPTESGEVQVQVGIMKVNAHLTDLRIVEETKAVKERQNVHGLGIEKARNIRTELDLRGMLSDDAVLETDKYLDDAYVAGLTQVYIIHGKGTGALRQAIHAYLKGHHLVASYRIGGFNEGREGVTVVELNRS